MNDKVDRNGKVDRKVLWFAMYKFRMVSAVVLLIVSGCSGEKVDPEAVTLITEAVTASAGRSASGILTVEWSGEGVQYKLLTSQFKFDSSGALSMTASSLQDFVSAPSSRPLLGGSELRYVGGSAYVRLSTDDAAALGIDVEGIEGSRVWLSADSEWLSTNPEAMSNIEQAYHFMILCRGPHIEDSSSLACDPLAAPAAFIETASTATVIGDSEWLGTPTTSVAFTLPPIALAGMSNDPAGSSGTTEQGLNVDLDRAGLLSSTTLESLFGLISLDSSDVLTAIDDVPSQLLGAGFEAEILIDSDKLIRRFSLSVESEITSEESIDPANDESGLALTAGRSMSTISNGSGLALTGGKPVNPAHGGVDHSEGDADDGPPRTHYVFDFYDFDDSVSVVAPPSELVVGDISLLIS